MRDRVRVQSEDEGDCENDGEGEGEDDGEGDGQSDGEGTVDRIPDSFAC